MSYPTLRGSNRGRVTDVLIQPNPARLPVIAHNPRIVSEVPCRNLRRAATEWALRIQWVERNHRPLRYGDCIAKASVGTWSNGAGARRKPFWTVSAAPGTGVGWLRSARCGPEKWLLEWVSTYRPRPPQDGVVP